MSVVVVILVIVIARNTAVVIVVVNAFEVITTLVIPLLFPSSNKIEARPRAISTRRPHIIPTHRTVELVKELRDFAAVPGAASSTRGAAFAKAVAEAGKKTWARCTCCVV